VGLTSCFTLWAREKSLFLPGMKRFSSVVQPVALLLNRLHSFGDSLSIVSATSVTTYHRQNHLNRNKTESVLCQRERERDKERDY
jgi:hypothetical protein